MKIRIKDIALKANVSTGTVDRVLHSRGDVAENTRKHVMKIVEEMGYEPNLIARTLASKKKFHMAVLIPDPEGNLYWKSPLAGMEKAHSEIAGFNAEINFYPFIIDDEISFHGEFEKLFCQKPDGIIFSPVFLDTSLKIIQICEENRIPYIFIDANIEGQNNLSYFGQNASRSGYLAARLMDYAVQTDGEILIINPSHEKEVTHHYTKREGGFISYFNGLLNTNKQLKIKSVNANTNSDSEINSVLDKCFKQNRSIKGIFITNSKIYKIARYLSNREINSVVLIGYDLLNENLSFLNNKTIDFLIGQKPEEQGYKSVLALFHYLLSGKKPEKTNFSPIDIITKDNFEFYKI
ncbi:MAG: LacI family DNA-binding transcriptional regulator [Bacteroidales bacterium]|nr:LacI family DNA-binding transcriptional regulator [Bacteroidales bacterium]